MNKTEKILYSGFAVVALGVIVAMLVTVFSPPKKIAEEGTVEPTPETEPAPLETASAEDEITPPEGYVGYWVDDDGNKVWLTREELDAEFAAVEEAEEEYERQEAERIAKEQAEKQARMDRPIPV